MELVVLCVMQQPYLMCLYSWILLPIMSNALENNHAKIK